MKKLLKNTLWVGMFLIYTGCHDYLDIRTPGIVNEDLQFADLHGYWDALYGIYNGMNSPYLYGKALSYDFVDDLAQLYRDHLFQDRNPFDKILQYDYSDVGVRDIIDGIWSEAYRLISAANNVLKHHTKGLTLLDSTETVEYNLIKGEALAVRAFMHFNLVRLFCENIIRNPQAKGIPYATEFSLESPVTRSLSDIYKLIIKDLSEAEKWLETDKKRKITYYDPHKRYWKDYQLDRRYGHLNLYAVKAILARVYLTKGNYSSAAQYAREVIASKSFVLNKPDSIDYYKRYNKYTEGNSESIFTLNNEGIHKGMRNNFMGTDLLVPLFVRFDVNSIYETKKFTATNYDRRYNAYFYSIRNPGGILGKGLRRLVEHKKGEWSNPILFQAGGVNVIRLPEMYYILSESLYDTDFNAAKRYLNKVRNSRGLTDIEDKYIATKDLFLKEMLKERLREFWGEGLIFYDYKRLNSDIKGIDGNIIKASNAIYVLPLPEKEIEYGK